MGQKVNPTLFRLGPVFNWSSRWFDDKQYKKTLLEDFKLRKALMERLKNAGISSIEIERSINSVKIIAYVSRPGMVIGRAGSGLEELKEFLYKILKIKKDVKNVRKIDIRVEPIKEPNLDAYLVAKNISDQLLRRLPHRRIMAQTVDKVMGSGAKGIRIVLAGRIGGAEIGRVEKLQRGKVPLSTIREHIIYASVPALTKKGYVGVKVWINRPEDK
ncbi:MAG: 30S ribosomal protein S3 [Candidatus Levybacteria bacterium CG_4_9_14_3_um_filter_35_16]|nr:MAG: 30S ribosomal protein S3 [Candidatus Levybacteria bacterium CG22_combo_CG10-13_8_21_14_all_35_11]PIY93867.1 MAG: 30S ribosomal protein S3 [Candidatus Levybacteria bacterium CG_4_10_14_0_8_um_filter_35_23]PJA91338.1 MAG: 30S ribosomal protein S3 [Candidatus Levybacteria bacterium CG_4_9_14_3_um_filter_35_16]PJC54777.1 MAG: 30S ribosomal protein S3 [Candidatus Levybacteria bacterium CG_4_9_14_0_2_um_filter_35_21]